MPDPRFIADMGVASVIAGVVLLGLAHLSKAWHRGRSR